MKEKFKIKPHIRNQFPEYIRRDHPAFIDFIEAYYEWLDNNPNFLRSASQLENLFDIDETMEIFLDDFKKTYINSFPINLVINPITGKKLEVRKLIKNIKNFYRSKGIKNSYRFIFRVFYNSEMGIYYPKEFILNLSDGRWINEKKIFLRPSDPNQTSLVGKTICQRSSSLDSESALTARARVTNSISYLRKNNYVLELTLEEIFGTFQTNYSVLDIDTGKNYGKTYSVLKDITVNDQGYGYLENQKINFTQLSESLSGVLPKARIRRISPGTGALRGKVLEIEISDQGLIVDSSNCGLSADNPIDLGGFTGGTGFSGELSFGALFDKREYYLGDKGLISTNMVLQDNYKYQEYSYVIRTDKSLSRYVDLVKGLLHPAGVQLLGEILISRCVLGDPETSVNIPKRNIKMIGNYLPYTFLTFDNISKWMDGSCYYSGLHDNLVICGADPCITGNPIASGVTFTEAAGASCTTADLPEDYPYEYWDTLPHPNTRIHVAIGLIHQNQLLDFYGPTNSGDGQGPTGWSEWNFSDENGGTTAQQEEWLEETLNSTSGRNFAGLRITLGSEFRKIPIYAFINGVNCTYDCRYTNSCVESDLNEFGAPILPPKIEIENENKYISTGISSIPSISISEEKAPVDYL